MVIFHRKGTTPCYHKIINRSYISTPCFFIRFFHVYNVISLQFQSSHFCSSSGQNSLGKINQPDYSFCIVGHRRYMSIVQSKFAVFHVIRNRSILQDIIFVLGSYPDSCNFYSIIARHSYIRSIFICKICCRDSCF